MSVDRAVEHFLGSDDKKRTNCACAMIRAFKDRFAVSSEDEKKCRRQGHGKAEGGMCGAAYAAILLLNKNRPEEEEHFKKYFIETAGSLKCKEIRKMKGPSCQECVEIAAKFMENLSNKEC